MCVHASWFCAARSPFECCGLGSFAMRSWKRSIARNRCLGGSIVRKTCEHKIRIFCIILKKRWSLVSMPVHGEEMGDTFVTKHLLNAVSSFGKQTAASSGPVNSGFEADSYHDVERLPKPDGVRIYTDIKTFILVWLWKQRSLKVLKPGWSHLCLSR